MRKKVLGVMMLSTFGACTFLTGVPGAVMAAAEEESSETLDDGYILPDSDSRYLTADEIEGMTAQELNYARNEIYARLGREFKSQELQDYFNSQSWYEPVYSPEEFSEDLANGYEKSNAQLLMEREYELSPGGYALDTGIEVNIRKDSRSEYEKMMDGEITCLDSAVEMDLDGDGEAEKAELSIYGDDPYAMNKYDLQIGDEVISGTQECLDENLYGVSLDEKTLLLIVYAAGPSDDPVSTFYIYDEQGIHEAGTIYDTPWDMTADKEADSISAAERCNIIGTASIEKTWKLTDESLDEVPVEYYKIVQFLTEEEYYAWLNDSMEVYRDMSLDSETTVLEPQYVAFPYTDASEWVYVQGENGDAGWINTSGWEFDTANKMFDGLKWAD